MIRLFVRRSTDISYLTNDEAGELDGPRDGPALWWPGRGSPDTAPEQVLGSRRRGSVVGYDLVVAAPRALSTLLGVGNNEEQRALVASHRGAVAASLDYLEERALVVRRTILGDAETMCTHWSSSVGFTHGINRAGEPHLHDHVLVPAQAKEYPLAIDGRALQSHLLAADALYRAQLRDAIGATTFRSAWRSFGGIEYVSGIDEGVRMLWPGRAADRLDKKMWSRAETVAQWRDDLKSYEAGPEVKMPTRARDRLNEHAFGAALESRNEIRRSDLVAAWANSATFGATAASVLLSVDHWYPELAKDHGLDGELISRTRARCAQEVSEHGARALLQPEIGHNRSRERTSLVRSRDFER